MKLGLPTLIHWTTITFLISLQIIAGLAETTQRGWDITHTRSTTSFAKEMNAAANSFPKLAIAPQRIRLKRVIIGRNINPRILNTIYLPRPSYTIILSIPPWTQGHVSMVPTILIGWRQMLISFAFICSRSQKVVAISGSNLTQLHAKAVLSRGNMLFCRVQQTDLAVYLFQLLPMQLPSS